MEDKKKIIIGGTHGKTTTTGLITSIFDKGGQSPSYIIGGEFDDSGMNAQLGTGKYFITEADESDGSIASFKSNIGVVTNIEEDHLDYYRDIAHIEKIFLCFMDNVLPEGKCYCYFDDERVKNLCKKTQTNVVGYGVGKQAHIRADNIVIRGESVRYDFVYFGQNLGQIEFNVIGRHNIFNSLPAVGIGLDGGLSFDRIRTLARHCYKVKRRMDIKFRNKEIIVVDDYAHHPTEIQVTLAALRTLQKQRVVAVFQPHRFTRLKALEEQFVHSFQDADELIITDVYPAGESPIPGVDSQKLVQKIKAAYPGKNINYVKNFADITTYIKSHTRPQDIIVILGAGNINEIEEELISFVRQNFD